jgi:hypothetical protein
LVHTFRAYLLVGKHLRVDATLQVGATTETIQITEQSPLIDFSSTTVAHNVTAEELDRLPKARSFQGLVLASPSVNSGEVEGGFQVNGASGAENQFVIDGVSTTSLVNGKSRQNAVFEILQEVQVKTGGIEAEYGGALGGVISTITKSGGNRFHGDVHYLFSGNPISAGPVKRLLLDPRNETTVSYVQDTKFKDNNNEIGYSLGGPFIKEKLWFFSAASPRWRDRSNDYRLTDGNFTLQQDQTYWQLFNKISFAPVERVRTNFTWLWSPTKSVGRLPGYNDAADTLSNDLKSTRVNQTVGFFAPQSSYSGQVDWTITNTSLLTLRAGRFWDNFKENGIPNVTSVTWNTPSTGLAGVPANLQQPVGFNNTPRLLITDHDLTTRSYFQLDASKYARLWGQHDLKGGWGYSKTVNNVFTYYPGGYVLLNWDRSFRTAGRGTYGYYEVNDFGTQGSTGGRMHNLYIQDRWRVHPRLTLNLGLRAENEIVPSFSRAIQDPAFQFGFGDKVAPRLGGTYDLFGDGRVKVYGSWGRFYDWVKYELSRGTFGGDYWRIYYRALDTVDVFNLNLSNRPGRNLWASEFRDRRVPGFDTVAPGLKPMSSDLTNAGVEFQLSPGMVFRGGYVHNNLRRTIEDLGVLDAKGDEVYYYANPGEGAALITPPSGGTKAQIPTPKPKRVYDAVELSLTRRFSKNFFGSASYVWSRLYGNYSGISASEEIRTPTTGTAASSAQQQGGSVARQGGNANRAWDLDELLFDSKGKLDVLGRLPTDRPHVVKLYGSYTFNFGTEIGGFFYGGSGTPITTYVNTINQTEAFVNGRGDLGRTPILTQTDMVFAHQIRVGEGKKLRFEFNALNLFNQKTSRHIFNYLNRGAGLARASAAIDLHDIDLFKGYDYNALILKSGEGRGAYDPRFGRDDLFNSGFAGRFMVKFIF